MPTRYHFHLESARDAIRDEEGVEAEDGDHAVQQALEVVEEMRTSGELPDTEGAWSLVILDQDGSEIRRILI